MVMDPWQACVLRASGVLTQTVPDAVALTCIGLAITPTSLLIQRDTPVFLIGA